MNILNISHAHCNDGLIASVVIMEATKGTDHKVTYLFMDYSQRMGGIAIEDYDMVLITDFSFHQEDIPTINNWLSLDKTVVVIDHHDGAKWIGDYDVWMSPENKDKDNFIFIYSEDHSGALLTAYMFKTEYQSEIMKRVCDLIKPFTKISDTVFYAAVLASDHDLFDFKHGDKTRYFAEGIKKFNSEQHPPEVKIGALLGRIHRIFAEIIDEGKPTLEANRALWRSILPNATVHEECGDFTDFPNGFGATTRKFATCNMPYNLISYAAEDYLSNNPDVEYVIFWSKLGTKYGFSFRARKGDNINLITIAKKFGGGGHKAASGANIMIDALVVQELTRSQRYLFDICIFGDLSGAPYGMSRPFIE